MMQKNIEYFLHIFINCERNTFNRFFCSPCFYPSHSQPTEMSKASEASKAPEELPEIVRNILEEAFHANRSNEDLIPKIVLKALEKAFDADPSVNLVRALQKLLWECTDTTPEQLVVHITNFTNGEICPRLYLTGRRLNSPTWCRFYRQVQGDWGEQYDEYNPTCVHCGMTDPKNRQSTDC